MRLSPSTLLVCALLATAAFADDSAVVDPAKKPAPIAEKKLEPVKTEVKVAPVPEKKLEPVKDAPVAEKKLDAAPLADKQVDTAPQSAAVVDEKSGDQVVVPAHPLADTSKSTEERAQLSPDDSDAALDRALGLSPKAEGEAAPEADGLGWSAFKTLLMLGVVVGMIYLTLNVGLRKMMGIKSGPLGGKGGVVNVVERIPLEQRRTLFVLKAAGEYLLVGTSEGGMTLISKLDTAEVERIQRERGGAQVQLSPFFQKLLSGQKKSGPPPQA